MSFITPGETLKRIRTKLDVTQHELTEIGISRNFISMYESGKRRISKETASKLVHMLSNIAIQKGIEIDEDIEYLYVSPEEAAQEYVTHNLKNNLNEEEINEIIEICRRYDFEELLHKAIIVKANILYEKTEYKNSFYTYQEALEMSIRLKEDYEISFLYNKLGKCKLELARFEEALIYFQKAYQHAIICDDVICKKNSIFNMALAYKKLGMTEDALINIDKFIGMRNKEQYIDDYINANMLKANCYMDGQNFLEALKIYMHLETTIQDESNLLLGYIYINIGVAYLNMEKIDDSLFYFEKAEEFSNKFDRLNLAYTLIEKSNVYIKMSLFNKATRLINEGITIARDFNDTICIIKGYSLLEKVYLKLNDQDKLEDAYNSLLEIYRLTCDKVHMNLMLNKLSLLNINKGNLEKSKIYLEEAINNP